MLPLSLSPDRVRTHWRVIVIFLALGSILGCFPSKQIWEPTSTIPVDPDILSLQNQIKNSQDDENRHLIETKVGVLVHNATRQANAAAKAPEFRPTVIRQITETEFPESRRSLGIIESVPNPLPAMEFIMENAWQAKINNGYVTVFAGAYTDDPQQGVIIVVTEYPLRFNFIVTPKKIGSVKIVDFKGFQLVLQTKNKDTFYFDVPGRAFISALGVVIPTITPNGPKE